MSGLLDWIKEEPSSTPEPEYLYILVRVRDNETLKRIRSILHREGRSIDLADVPLYRDGRGWPYITGSKGRAEEQYATVNEMFTSIMNYAKRRRARQRDFVLAGER